MTKVRLYLMTKQKIVQLERHIAFQRVPCVGEWLKFARSGLFPSQVTEVTHDEHGNVDIVIGAQKDDSGELLFHETVQDLQEDVGELVADGWKVVSEGSNTYWGRLASKRVRPTRPDKPKSRR